MSLFTMIILSVLSVNLYAKLPNFSAQDIKGDYKHDYGEVFINKATMKYSVLSAHLDEIQAQFRPLDNGLWVEYEQVRIFLETDLSFFNILQSFSFDSASISFEQSKLDFKAPQISARLQPRNFELTGVSLSSDISNYDQDAKEFNVLEAILLNSDLAIESLKLDPFMLTGVREDFLAENPGALQEAIKAQEHFASASFLPVRVKNIRLVLKQETFLGSMLINSWLSAYLYVGGRLELDKLNNKLTITLNKARLGYFSILRIALRVLRTLNLEDITVQGNKIIIDFTPSRPALDSVEDLLDGTRP